MMSTAPLLDKVLPRVLGTGSRPATGLTEARWSTIVPASLDETFAFFSNAANLQRLTPPWVNFSIRTPLPIVMAAGVEIDYRIVVRGLPLPWRSRIDVWEPGVRFVDRQIIGPYRWWSHTHAFERANDGTRVIDIVEFAPRLAWATSRLVAQDVDRIFRYRAKALRKIDWETGG